MQGWEKKDAIMAIDFVHALDSRLAIKAIDFVHDLDSKLAILSCYADPMLAILSWACIVEFVSLGGYGTQSGLHEPMRGPSSRAPPLRGAFLAGALGT